MNAGVLAGTRQLAAGLRLATYLVASTSFAVSASSPARAGEPVRGKPTIGLRMAWLGPVSIGGGIGPYTASAESLTLGLDLYGDWQLSNVVAVGLGIPATLNAPGPTSNAYDIGATSRIRMGYPLDALVYPYIVAGIGPAWSHQPQKVWLTGFEVTTAVGASVRVAGALSITGEVGYRYTSFAGDMPLYHSSMDSPAPILHGEVRTGYLVLGGGFELRL
jgi:opacity protein-like surface antigen